VLPALQVAQALIERSLSDGGNLPVLMSRGSTNG
jgi:hypothetical protein